MKRKILEPTEPSTIGREKIRDAVEKVQRRKAKKIAITKATAHEIRESLGITALEHDVATKASKRTKRTIKPAK